AMCWERNIDDAASDKALQSWFATPESRDVRRLLADHGPSDCENLTFKKFLARLGSPEVSFSSVDSLIDKFQIHPLLIDPLRSKQVQKDFVEIQLRKDFFEVRRSQPD